MNQSRQEVILSEMRGYSDKWEVSSKANEREGYYDWMLAQLTPDSNILEIGCGAGISTLKLLNNNNFIVSIDENPYCIRKAYSYLSNNNVEVSLQRRIGNIVIRDGKNKKGPKWLYERKLEKISGKLQSNILMNILMEGDIQNDKELIMWLIKNYKFDYIVCWLMGTYDYKTLDANYEGVFLPNEKDKYRWKVLSELIKLQQSFLESKPIVHIVDRIEYPKNESDKKEIIKEYSEKLKIDMTRTKVVFQKYKVREGVNLIGIENEGEINNIYNVDIGLISILIKP